LLTLFGNGGIDESAVVDKLGQLNKEKQEFEDQINRLSKSIEQKIDINAAKEKIEQYCKRVRANLDKCTLQDKKKALNALDVQMVAIPQEMKIRIAVPLEFITIEQTSA
jgi:sRNA-binding protein